MDRGGRPVKQYSVKQYEDEMASYSTNEFRGGLSLRANRVWTFEQARDHNAAWLLLRLDGRAWGREPERLVEEMGEALRPFLGGQCPLHIEYSRPGARARLLLGPDWRVTPTDALLKRLQRLFGADRVEVEYGRPRPQFPDAAAPERRKRA